MFVTVRKSSGIQNDKQSGVDGERKRKPELVALRKEKKNHGNYEVKNRNKAREVWQKLSKQHYQTF